MDFIAQYTYLSTFEKNVYRLLGELTVAYLFLGFVVITNVIYKETNLFFGSVMLIAIVMFVVELFELLLRLVVNRIRELTKRKKRKK